ncbi:hypothetical protein Syun_013622 [Stephania yunnanensis]|uniref:Leucine-rich repeat-containing N-terminal plant-type domain-containing protein n=1 Tax=Stephania yunnanensis TaxID=152371 RepID=A0AAP0JHZ0_9MAGN
MAFKSTTSDPNNNISSWAPTTTNSCSSNWFGATCINNHISHIVLEGCTPSPRPLTALSTLCVLGLKRNHLSDTLPTNPKQDIIGPADHASRSTNPNPTSHPQTTVNNQCDKLRQSVNDRNLNTSLTSHDSHARTQKREAQSALKPSPRSVMAVVPIVSD